MLRVHMPALESIGMEMVGLDTPYSHGDAQAPRAGSSITGFCVTQIVLPQNMIES